MAETRRGCGHTSLFPRANPLRVMTFLVSSPNHKGGGGGPAGAVREISREEGGTGEAAAPAIFHHARSLSPGRTVTFRMDFHPARSPGLRSRSSRERWPAPG